MDVAFRAWCLSVVGAAALLAGCQSTQAGLAPTRPVASAGDEALEGRVRSIVAGMTLEQKVGQMTQADIRSITPDDVRRFYIGSVLNGGGAWPGKNMHSSVDDWLRLSDAFYRASMSTDMATKIPVIWGVDAVHGHNNVYGATLFPHNIGLGAAHDPKLIERIGRATAGQVRATGISWTFAPTLAVVQNPRWGRTYESYSSDPELVRSYGEAIVRGLQGQLGTSTSQPRSTGSATAARSMASTRAKPGPARQISPARTAPDITVRFGRMCRPSWSAIPASPILRARAGARCTVTVTSSPACSRESLASTA
jgi:beta-glucosidase